jgi:hypothetical protein
MIKLYCTLDTLYDTRLGVIENYLGKELFKNCFDIDTYKNRTTDKFAFISELTFSELYKNRTTEVLLTPRPTMMQEYVAVRALWYSQDSLMHGGDGQIEVHINTYPYLLTELQKERFVQAYRDRMPMRTKVVVFTKKTIPVNEHIYAELFLYDGLELLNKVIADNTDKIDVLTNSILVVPDNIYIDKSDNSTKQKTRDELLKLNVDIMEPFVNLEFISAAFF